MKISVFTEGSSSTKETSESTQLKDYFKGNFLTVSNFVDELLEIGSVDLHVLSEKYGYVDGFDEISTSPNHLSDSTDLAESKSRMQDELLKAAKSDDAISVLLTASMFNDIVFPIWGSIVDNTDESQIWCIAASRRSLESIDLDQLRRNGCKVITYQRVGVTRIGRQTRNQLLEHLKEKNPSDPGQTNQKLT